jgi:quercetin dioxygenase-like cupin family protein
LFNQTIPPPTLSTTSLLPQYPENVVSNSSPEVAIGCVANMFVRQMCFKQAGHTEQGHTHSFDHLTLLATGRLLVEVPQGTTIYSAPAMIFIHKDVAHKLTALEPNTLAYCIHGLRDLDVSEDIISTDMVPNGVDQHKLVRHIMSRP